MNYGLILGESHDDYHASEAFGCHKLDALRPYPLLFQKKYVTKEIPKANETDALRFGRYFHLLALEGEDAANDSFCVSPDCDKRTKDGKATWATFVEQSAGKGYVGTDEVTKAWRMVKAIRDKPAAVELLANGKAEVTFRHKMAAFSLQCRVDWFDADAKAGPLCVNLKSIESLEDFDYQYEKFGYYRSDAFYRLVVSKVLGIETFSPQMVDLVVEKNEPYQCAIRVPDAMALEIGAKEIMEDLVKLKGCFESNVWPGEPNEARPVSLSHRKVKAHQETAA